MNSKNFSNLFSEETLDSISTAVIIGGGQTNNCNGENCAANCGCPENSNVSIVILACTEQTNTSTKNNYY